MARTSHTDVSLWFVLDSDTPDAITPDPHECRSVRWWFPKEVRAGDPGSFDPHLVRMLDKFDALLPGGGSGLVGPRAGWATTTHDWSLDVDENHLWDVLERWATFGAGGAAHLVLEVLAYADDEATALGRTGHCTVTEHADGSFTTSDDGRGTDTRRDRWGAVVRRPVMSTRDVRFSGDDGGPALPDGLPRRGMSVVAALSTWLEHTNRRPDGSWTQRYESGSPQTELVELDPAPSAGTTVRFLPEPALVAPSHPTAGQLAAFPHLRVTNRSDRQR